MVWMVVHGWVTLVRRLRSAAVMAVRLVLRAADAMMRLGSAAVERLQLEWHGLLCVHLRRMVRMMMQLLLLLLLRMVFGSRVCMKVERVLLEEVLRLLGVECLTWRRAASRRGRRRREHERRGRLLLLLLLLRLLRRLLIRLLLREKRRAGGRTEVEVAELLRRRAKERRTGTLRGSDSAANTTGSRVHVGRAQDATEVG